MLKYFEYSLKRIGACGVNPFEKIHVVKLVANSVTITFLAVLIILKIAYEPDLKATEIWAAFFLTAMKYMILIQKKGQLKDLLKGLDHFWQQEAEDEKISHFMVYLKCMINIWKCVMYGGSFMYFMKPLFVKGYSVFFCYIPPHIPFLLVYILELNFIFVAVNAYTGFNMLLTTFIVLTTIQFRQINTKLEGLDFEGIKDEKGWRSCLKDIRECIEHHGFLMKVVGNLNEILYLTVAILIAATTIIMCLHMYVLLTMHLTTTEIIRLLTTFVAMIFEFLLGYGLPSQMLMDEAGDLSNALYCGCSWHLAPAHIKKIILLMLMRSQTVVCISVKKLIIVNNQTFLMMLKTAYSFYTFLRTVS